MVRRDIIDFKPLHSKATSNDPEGIFNTNPLLCTGTPTKFAKPDDVTAETVWIGGVTISKKGTGTANSKNNIGNLILLKNSHPNIYNTIPDIVITNDKPDKNRITHIAAMLCNTIPMMNNINPVWDCFIFTLSSSFLILQIINPETIGTMKP